jgi:hypothetical protein
MVRRRGHRGLRFGVTPVGLGGVFLLADPVGADMNVAGAVLQQPGHQLSAGDPAWHRRRDNMWHFYNASPAKPHYAALRQILSAYAGTLAGKIDQR